MNRGPLTATHSLRWPGLPARASTGAPREWRAVSLWSAACLTAVLHGSVALSHHLLASGSGLTLSAALYYTSIAALVVCYALMLQLVTETPSRREWFVIAGVPLAIQVGWLMVHPIMSVDAYSYLVDAAHAYAGLSPYEHASREVAGTDLGRRLLEYGWRPKAVMSPYGPVWINLVSVVGPFVGNLAMAVRLVKVIAIAATAVTAFIIFRVAPVGARTRAFAAFWWNPVVIIECAGEGHNDAVMTAAALLALWLLRRHALNAATVALTAAALTKWVPLFFGPACLMYAWRNRLLTRRAVLSTAALAIAVTSIAYWRLWAGANTFAGVGTVGGPRFVASITGSLTESLANHHVILLFLRLAAASVLGVVTIDMAARTRTHGDVIRAWTVIALTFVLLAAPLYWPWYVVMPIALLAVTGDLQTIIVLTVTSRMVAPLNLLRLRGAFSTSTEVWLTTVVALWLPLAWLVWRAVDRRGQATGAEYLLD
jgi:alpha-1,6-mannosyltransferase